MVRWSAGFEPVIDVVGGSLVELARADERDEVGLGEALKRHKQACRAHRGHISARTARKQLRTAEISSAGRTISQVHQARSEEQVSYHEYTC